MARPKTRLPGEILKPLYVEAETKQQVQVVAAKQGRQIKDVTEEAWREYVALRPELASFVSTQLEPTSDPLPV